MASWSRLGPTLATVLAAAGLAAPGAWAGTGFAFTAAGTSGGLSGDGGPATAAQLAFPSGVAALPGGGYLVADTSNHRIRHVGADGTITTVAGTSEGDSGDGGPATAAQLDNPNGVAATADGGLLIASMHNFRVRRVAPDGTITTVAGTTAGLSGDGGPATGAQLDAPFAVSVTGSGGFLVADADNGRIRQVASDGTITTVAGTTPGLSGDGAAATAAQLDFPTGVAATADGGFLIADSDNARIRRVGPGGTITTVAGTTFGYAGDGGPATAARLDFPSGVTPTAVGGFLIADAENHRVRHVSAAGTITTITGTGVAGQGGDGGPAGAAQLNFPAGVAATFGGGVLVADAANDRVRFVDVDVRSGLPGLPGPPGPEGPGGPGGTGGAVGPGGPAGAGGAAGSRGAAGPTGPAGTDGGGGPPGPAGAAGAAGAARLVLALPLGRLRATARRPVALPYAASVAAAVELRVLRGRRLVERARGRARSGANVLRVRAPRQPGRYTLALVATGADGRTASGRATLVVRARR